MSRAAGSRLCCRESPILDLDHDEMDDTFETIGPELIHFFSTGRSTEGAAREPLDGDPFVD